MCISNAIERLESRINEQQPTLMYQWMKSIESRLAALETWKENHFEDDATPEQPAPAKDEREWIPLEGQKFWIDWAPENLGVSLAIFGRGNFYSLTDGEPAKFKHPTHIMPYREGDTKPAPPSEKGA